MKRVEKQRQKGKNKKVVKKTDQKTQPSWPSASKGRYKHTCEGQNGHNKKSILPKQIQVENREENKGTFYIHQQHAY